MHNKKVPLVILICLFSCSSEKEVEKVKIKNENTLKNFTFTGFEKNKKSFEVKVKEALEVVNSNEVKLKDIIFLLYQTQENILAKANTGIYEKASKNFVFKDLTLNHRELKIFTQNANFNEVDKNLNLEQIKLSFFKHNFSANKAFLNKDFSKLTMKKVTAKLFF